MEEKYLPIGSVCMLKGGKKAVMVAGYGIQPKEDPNVVYDYLGALYPEGIIDMEQNMAFNHENIEKVLFRGYETDEQRTFNQKILEVMNPIAPSNKDDLSTISTNNFNSQEIIPVDDMLSTSPSINNGNSETLNKNNNVSQQQSSYIPPFSNINDDIL